jgi:sugar O-acyltransferase (sialic acid O-acetyltransferase NeuD family)
VADILLRSREAGAGAVPVGFLDDDPARLGKRVLNLPVLGTLAQLAQIERDAVVVAIGDNRLRQKIFMTLRAQGEHLHTAIHPRATIAPDVTIGPGAMVCAGVVVNTGSTIGANTILNTGATIDHHNQIGDHCHVAPGAHLGGEVTIGDGTLVGIGATVLPRMAVGRWCVVGAGAVVHKDVADRCVAVGVPARQVSKIANNDET